MTETLAEAFVGANSSGLSTARRFARALSSAINRSIGARLRGLLRGLLRGEEEDDIGVQRCSTIENTMVFVNDNEKQRFREVDTIGCGRLKESQ